MNKTDYFKEYDRKTSQRMTKLIKKGRKIRRPVRSLKNASKKDRYDRGKFLFRKASQVLKRNDPLRDEKGFPTPAAMQFKRWAVQMPKTKLDIIRILALGKKEIEKYKPQK